MPERLDITRQIAGALWSTVTTSIAVHEVTGLEWWESSIVGVVGTAVTGSLFGMFYR